MLRTALRTPASQRSLAHEGAKRRPLPGLELTAGNPPGPQPLSRAPLVADFSRIRLFPRERLQAKLKLGAQDDQFEREADRVANHVMQGSEPASSDGFTQTNSPSMRRACIGCEPSSDELGVVRLYRQVAPDEIRERLIRAFLSETETLQRQANFPERAEEEDAGERILMQSKASVPPSSSTGPGLESRLRSLKGGGEPLPSAVREDLGLRFGHDFATVRVHTDGDAANIAQAVNARAFTVGSDVAFATGEYRPYTQAGRRLLAHELTHVVQQGRAAPALQRKIVVGGNPYVPSATYLAWLNANFGPAMKEFVEHMHNGGSPPVYSFSSFEQMGFEVRTRANAIKGIEKVHQGCCDYYDSAHPPYLNAAYWDHVGAGVNFTLKSPLPPGKKPSDAVEAIFAPGAGTRLECLSMTLAIEFFSMLKALGPAKFNVKFAAGIQISAEPSQPLYVGASRKYDIIAVGSKAEILPGDWVYFTNFHDYTTRVPGGYWQGENAIYLGGGKFRGFGVAELSEHDMNQELVNRYNTEGAPPLTKTVADLIADGGGLQLNPVIRPIISTLVP